MSKEIKNIQTLCADIVQNANSGHPGAPLGLSQFVYILYTEFLNLNPENPRWLNRDIFILSNGHTCAIQYLMNYFIGYLTMDDLKHFRKLNSHTPGHPERDNKGIEITTGPLGQGVASSTGYAISLKILQKYGFNNQVYCIFGDGCYQEGISQETFSLCSKLKLNNITYIYDFNKSTIDGPTELSMSESVKKRFESLNFTVIEIEDVAEQIREALNKKSELPKVIILHTKIGKDSVLEGSEKSHGNPLGEENVDKLKKKLSMPQDKFWISDELNKSMEQAKARMRVYVKNNEVDLNLIKHEKLKTILYELSAGERQTFQVNYTKPYCSEKLATRQHFKNALNALETNLLLLSGCADLLPSIGTKLDNTENMQAVKHEINSYIRYGIREHSMCGIMNGIASHGIFNPLGGTFLNFCSYGVASIKIACIDKLKVMYVFTHDSIGLGEDGPTHQPIETLAMLRALPHLITFRPADGRETRAATKIALQHKGPTAVILTRQKVPELKETKILENEGIAEKGAYFLEDTENPQIILIATGSEVYLALEVKEKLKMYRTSVVSMLSMELFEMQSKEYQNAVIPNRNRHNRPFVVSIEALTTFGWSKYSDCQIGQDTFGRSGKSEDVFRFFGFTSDSIVEKIKLKYNEFIKERTYSSNF